MNDSEPEVLLSTVEDQTTDDTDTYAPTLADVYDRLEALEHTVDGMREGINTIGQMMNAVGDMFSDMVNKVNQGGIGALVGNLIGKKNDA